LSITTKAKFYICTEAFSVGLQDGDVWFRAGQKVHADHPVFDGESGKNRQKRLFIPEETE
jgi:hypothetical protein